MATAKNLAVGQVVVGSKVEWAPESFAQTITTYAGIAAAGNVPTVAILAGAGTVGSITSQNGYDQAGNFILTAGTASINGGSLCSVTFGQPLTATPSAVIVNAGYTAGTLGLAVGAVSVSKSGFVIQGPAPASGAAYLMSYQVIR
jgi:hypothetical protein